MEPGVWPGVLMTRTSIETPFSPAEADLLAVREGRDRLVELEALARGHEVRNAQLAREGRPAAHVVGVDVGVEDADDPRPPLGGEALVPLGVPARVHDHRLAARDDDVREAGLAAAVDLPELEAGGRPRRAAPSPARGRRRRRSSRP